MDFDRSTQARSWLFDAASLAACRERADVEASAIANVERRVRKFASGFHSRFSKEREGSPAANDFPNSPFPTFSPSDKETLVRFHAHQIQALVGPTALLSELCTTETVLSTAIMLFRRFYLSNSILDINPRKMAAACAFFAAKLEEERIDVSPTKSLMVTGSDALEESVQHFLSCPSVCNVPGCRCVLKFFTGIDIFGPSYVFRLYLVPVRVVCFYDF
jgi:hypothetical protein